MKNDTNTTNDAGRASFELDEKLASAAQQAVRLTVKAMPDEMPSMAWRSQLNERILAEAKRGRARRRAWWILSPSFGLAATGALVFALVFNHHVSPVAPASPSSGSVAPVSIASSSSASLEESLFNSHADTETSQDVVGSGLNSGEIQAADEQTGSSDSDS